MGTRKQEQRQMNKKPPYDIQTLLSCFRFGQLFFILLFAFGVYDSCIIVMEARYWTRMVHDTLGCHFRKRLEAMNKADCM